MRNVMKILDISTINNSLKKEYKNNIVNNLGALKYVFIESS